MNLKAPANLTAAAQAYWRRHAKPLQEAGVLTEQDHDSFALLCRLWGLLQVINPEEDDKAAIRFVNYVKQYQCLAKQFGLLPRERKQAKMQVENRDQDDEFGLEGR